MDTSAGSGLVPVTDAQANAFEAAAKFGTNIVTEGSNLARFVGRILGTAPDDAVGLVLGDPLRFIRTAIAQGYDAMLNETLRRRQIKQTQPVSPSVAIPLLRGAYDEGRPELQKMWAELIAAAMDPKRANDVRLSFIDILKRLDPPDTLILNARHLLPGNVSPNALTYFSASLSMERDTVLVSVENLVALGCFRMTDGTGVGFELTAKGRQLMAVCSSAP